MATMKVGERAVFSISSDYGYGDEGYEPVIPGGAKLFFDVEMCVVARARARARARLAPRPRRAAGSLPTQAPAPHLLRRSLRSFAYHYFLPLRRRLKFAK